MGLALLFIWLPVQYGYLYPWEGRVMIWLMMLGFVAIIAFSLWMFRKLSRTEKEEVRTTYDAWRSSIAQ
jgi:NADH:ubiquinone oxidoreductase subunit 3 (subunit A)